MRKSTLLVLLLVVVGAVGAGLLLLREAGPDRAGIASSRFEAAVARWQAEDYDGALALLREAAEADPDHRGAQLLRAEILSRRDEEAARALLAGIEPSGLSEDSRAFAAVALLRLGEDERARAMAGTVSAEQPVGAELALAQAQVALRLDRDAVGARRALEHVLRLEPDHVRAKQLLARLLFEAGDVLEQVRAKSLARELDAVDRLPLALLGRMLFSEDTPLFEEEIVYFGQRLLEHPDFEASPFAGNLEFYRVMARRFKAAGRLDLALEIEEARRQHPDATATDLISYLDVALQTGRLEEFRDARQELEAVAGDTPRGQVLLAAEAHLRGDESAVLEHVRQAMEADDPGTALVEAVRYLGRLRPFSPALEKTLAERLLEAEGLAPGDVLIAANTVLQSLSDEAAINELIEEIEARFADRPDVLAPWLRSIGQAEAALEQAVRVLDAGNAEILPLVVDLYCETGRPEAAAEAYREHGEAHTPFARDVMEARIAMGRDDSEAAGAIWDEAWRRARGNSNYRQMLSLCHLAFAMRDYERLSRAYDPLIANGVGLRREEFVFLAGQEIRRGRTAEARQILEEAAVFYPDDADMANDRHYLSILLDEGDYRVIDAMEEIVEAHPGNSFYRFTLALAYLVNEFRGEAMETVEMIDFEADRFPHASRAIYAAVLAANGHDGPAQLVLNRVDRERLLPREREVLEPFLGEL